MKKIIILSVVIALFLCSAACTSNNTVVKETEKQTPTINEEKETSSTINNDYDYSYDTDKNEEYEDDLYDWMKDQSEGKDYSYDDGGDYFCMGKGDTCSGKTNNAYDFYCSSCDPDGDNIEG